MEGVEQEIAQKVIEKSCDPLTDPTPEPVEDKQPVKKPRSQKQQEAFAKARAKRMENLAKKRIEEENNLPDEVGLDPNDPFFLPTDVPPPNQTAVKKKRGRPRGSTKLKTEEPHRPAHNYPHPVQHQIPSPVNHNIPTQPNPHAYFNPYSTYAPPPSPPAQIHNYYYGTPPPSIDKVNEDKKIKFMSIDSDEDDDVEQNLQAEEQFIEEPQYAEPEPLFKYRFA